MKLSSEVLALCSLSSSILGGAYGSNSALRQRERTDQEESTGGGDEQLQPGELESTDSLDQTLEIELVNAEQPSSFYSSMPKAGTVIPGSYIVRVGLSVELLGISVHEVAESLGVSSDRVLQRKFRFLHLIYSYSWRSSHAFALTAC
jgi:hypothetical protein